MKKKSQAWHLDFIVGASIFTLVAITFFHFMSSQIEDRGSQYENILIDAKSVSSSLLLKGYPDDWDPDTVQRIGLSDGDNRINNIKVFHFYNLTQNDYERAKSLLGTRYEFIIFFLNSSDEIPVIESYLGNVTITGKTGVTPSNVGNEDPANLVKLSRLVIRDKDITDDATETIRLMIYMWNER